VEDMPRSYGASRMLISKWVWLERWFGRGDHFGEQIFENKSNENIILSRL
jgi:hypothetical protein